MKPLWMKVDVFLFANPKLEAAAESLPKHRGDVVHVWLALLSLVSTGNRTDGVLSRHESRPTAVANRTQRASRITPKRVSAALQALSRVDAVAFSDGRLRLCGYEDELWGGGRKSSAPNYNRDRKRAYRDQLSTSDVPKQDRDMSHSRGEERREEKRRGEETSSSSSGTDLDAETPAQLRRLP